MQETTRGQGTSDAGLSVQATEVEAGKGKAENQTRVTRAEFIDAFLPWAPFHSALTAHDRAVFAELSKGDASSSLFRRARLRKMLNKKSAAAEIAAGKRWNSRIAKWE